MNGDEPTTSPRSARDAPRVVAVFAACAGALFQLSLLLRLYAGRVRYPWDLEWLEGTWLYQAHRVLTGLPTYGPFRDGYLASNHPPGYPLVLAALGAVLGLDYPMARTASLAFFLGAVALVARAIARQELGRLERVGLVAFAVGAAAAGVPVFAGFCDLVREDAMAVFLSVLCASLVDVARPLGPRRIAVVACVIAAIVFTRLPAVFFCAWVVLHVFRRDRRAGLLLAFGAIVASAAALALMQVSSKGTYFLLTVTLVREHRFVVPRVGEGLLRILRFSPFVLATPLAAVALDLRGALSTRTSLWVGMLLASLPASLLPFAKVGGFDNDLMPTVFLVGPATALVAGDVLRALAQRPKVERGVAIALFASAAAFLFLRTYSVDTMLPTAELRRRVDAANAMVASLPGGVLCPRHPFIPVRLGQKNLQWSDQPYYDMQWSGVTDLDLGDYVDRAGAAWAFIPGDQPLLTDVELATRYQLDRPVHGAPETIVGLRSQLQYLLRRADSEEGARLLFDFEGDLAGWTPRGDAFRIATADVAGARPVRATVGARVATSFHPVLGDAATGTLTSPPFVIDRPRLALRLGGGWKPATRVELRIGGATVRSATGIFEKVDVLVKETWDVGDLQGREAELVLVDEDTGPWGHLLVDQVVLY